MRKGAAGSAGVVQLETSRQDQLDYNDEENWFGQARDPEQVTGTLPYTGKGTWNARKILTTLSQVDDQPLTTSDNNRCYSAAVLATVIQDGPAAILATAKRVMVQLGARIALTSKAKPMLLADMALVTGMIGSALGRLGNNGGTYEDLRYIAHGMQRVVDPNNTGTQDDQAPKLARMAGKKGHMVDADQMGWDDAEILFEKVKSDPKTKYVLGVGTKDGPELTHAITLGWDGDVYLYDPFPRKGTQILHLSKQKTLFEDYFEFPENAEGEWPSRPWKIIQTLS